MEQARLKIREAMDNKEIHCKDLKNNIDFRNELMRQIRRNSSLTLKQIGELFGGISESRVSRILGKGS
jgi:DNA-directed RNA polymerase specialized sigma subunit